MTATAAEALELALWLHRAPARRTALVGRPLPEGIGQLLRIAGAAPDQVAAAALITGQPEATVLEAVRFYLQQILFHESADAYRVLGLNPGASHAQAREHHRLLQHWLHPDRHGANEWESIYAGRINRAWTQLRTPQAREAYDSALAARGSRQGGEYPPSARPLPPPTFDPPRTRTRNLTLVVLLGCVGLLVLIAMRNEQPPQWRDDRAEVANPMPATDRTESAVPHGEALVAAMEVLAEEAAVPVENATEAIVQPVASLVLPPAPPVVPRAATLAPTRAVPVSQVPAPVPARSSAALPQKVEVPAVLPAPAPALAVAANPEPIRAPPIPTEVAAVAQPLPDPVARMRQARSRAGEVLAYLGDPAAIQPPVWNDLATAESAAAARSALHARVPAGARLALDESQWRLSPDGASLDAGYRAGPRLGRAETGQLQLDFVWREGRLLVRQLTLTPQ